MSNVLSQPFIQELCTPQGSVLSCTLFTVAININIDNLLRPMSATLYVDNFVFHITATDITTVQRLVVVCRLRCI